MLKLEREPRWLFTQDLAYTQKQKNCFDVFCERYPFTFDDIDDMGSIEFSMETAIVMNHIHWMTYIRGLLI